MPSTPAADTLPEYIDDILVHNPDRPQCPICYKTPSEFYLILKPESVRYSFCHSCVSKLNKCPFTRVKFRPSDIAKDLRHNDIVSAFEVYCPRKHCGEVRCLQSGCHVKQQDPEGEYHGVWQGRLDALEYHLEKCDSCWLGCGEKHQHKSRLCSYHHQRGAWYMFSQEEREAEQMLPEVEEAIGEMETEHQYISHMRMDRRTLKMLHKTITSCHPTPTTIYELLEIASGTDDKGLSHIDASHLFQTISQASLLLPTDIEPYIYVLASFIIAKWNPWIVTHHSRIFNPLHPFVTLYQTHGKPFSGVPDKRLPKWFRNTMHKMSMSMFVEEYKHITAYLAPMVLPRQEDTDALFQRATRKYTRPKNRLELNNDTLRQLETRYGDPVNRWGLLLTPGYTINITSPSQHLPHNHNQQPDPTSYMSRFFRFMEDHEHGSKHR
ncbi:hypothetical protein HDV00_010005 [Rhizophlyctis rosea]|nr:hypothetical protein HDV00_010005 [Rhizophlyctis rosea]